MGACDTGCIGAMGLIHGGTPWERTTLDWGDGIDLWGLAMGERDTWLDRGNGIDIWGCATLTGSGRWD